ncbi:MAG: type I methionyl aminopeptidase [Candidatus Kerfeldbacteria bacterium]|nr:type I methionyl aminopeptidase [Candidatus Kerfeldbacteria bacterium]
MMVRLRRRATVDQDAMRRGGHRLATLLHALAADVRPGMTTAALDRRARSLLAEHSDTPAFLGYRGYPAVLCTSRNAEVVHGIPRDDTVIRSGDILSLDFGIITDGWYSDMAVTIPVGAVSSADQALIDATRDALAAAIRIVRPGVHIGDIGATVQALVEGRGFGVVRDLVGHGIGRELHEDPQIPNVGVAGQGSVLRAGMAIAIEPMVTAGGYAVRFLDDGWTVVTTDGSRAAHFEHTVLVTRDGGEILTSEAP